MKKISGPGPNEYARRGREVIRARNPIGRGDFSQRPWARRYSERTIGLAGTLAKLVTGTESKLIEGIQEIIRQEGVEQMREAIACMKASGMTYSSILVGDQVELLLNSGNGSPSSGR